MPRALRGSVILSFEDAFFTSTGRASDARARRALRRALDALTGAVEVTLVRIVLAFVVGILVSRMDFATSPYAWAIAFVGGMLPKWFFEQIVQIVRSSTALRARFPALWQGSQLTELDGLGVFDQTRLHDEGVTNVENLANADLVGLLIETRISPAQLVSWSIRRSSTPAPTMPRPSCRTTVVARKRRTVTARARTRAPPRRERRRSRSRALPASRRSGSS